jgi:hypothetical protein
VRAGDLGGGVFQCIDCGSVQPDLFWCHGRCLLCDARGKSKDTAHCCTSKRDSLNRLPIGYCGPECERRPK